MKNLIIGTGGAGTVFLDSAKCQNLPETNYLSIKSEDDLLENIDLLQTSEKVFIVGSFAASNPNSAFFLTEMILAKLNETSKKVYLLVILPFKFEGRKRRELSFSRIKNLYDLDYRILVFDNQDMVYTRDNEMPLTDSFRLLYQKISLKIVEFMQGDFKPENRNWQKWQFLLNYYVNEINQIYWFRHFPSMNPYCGSNYANNTKRKILLIGGKSYQPSDLPLSPYFGELDEIFAEFFYQSTDPALTNIAYLNILKRPEPEEVIPVKYQLNGTSYQNLATTVKQVISMIKPDLVIFVSDLAWDKISPFLGIRVLSNGIKIEFTCSPDSSKWNDENSEFGKNKFRKLLGLRTKISLKIFCKVKTLLKKMFRCK